MIRRLSANKASFKTVEFSPGFNVVIADRTMESTKKDSRNGLGKSTLLDIIHFCLGAGSDRGKGLLVPALAGWEFSMALLVGNEQLTASRAIDRPNAVVIGGDVSSWAIPPEIRDGRQVFALKDWNSGLGAALFGLPPGTAEEKYQPTWRSLISYFVRRGKDAFTVPFEHHRKQSEWDKQVNNAFLLGLAWEDAAEWQGLKDKMKALKGLRDAGHAGVLGGFTGSMGDLEATRVRLTAQSEEEATGLESFRVHPQYEHIEERADILTAEIHELLNANTMDRRRLELYQQSVATEEPPPLDSLERLYREAGVALPGVALRRVDEVRAFHNTLPGLSG